ncbi:TetR/AcrR family transcriptional regulator [Georgenia yuyongxinii]|uniref:TetR/AcrR family transcriptional regulator n=1 Tax=Georgenia yuyongxinii TaxID=2589797 RepID=A0A5B8C6Z6_9MICO|nr:TetR family transcriptional regulator [Georgenia yuyongxinii]QDC26214.1 TetR/AcrR family transcriptional regulator [Georgenia yuyongxinii]
MSSPSRTQPGRAPGAVEGARAPVPAAGARAPRRRDPARTRQAILDAAEEEFSERGFLGGRVDAIAERTSITKRMIYYYFGDKQGLYLAALEQVYREMRQSERAVHLDDLEPVEALRTFVLSTIDFQEARPSFVRMVSFENTLGAENIAGIESLRELNAGLVDSVDRLLRRGRTAGVFRDGPDAPDALELHQLISSLAFYRVSNRATFREIFDHDMLDPAHGETFRRRAVALVVDHVLVPGTGRRS